MKDNKYYCPEKETARESWLEIIFAYFLFAIIVIPVMLIVLFAWLLMPIEDWYFKKRFKE